MNFNTRVKVLGQSIDELTKMGFAVNAYDCQPGEFWVVGCSSWELQRSVERNKLTTISQYETLRG